MSCRLHSRERLTNSSFWITAQRTMHLRCVVQSLHHLSLFPVFPLLRLQPACSHERATFPFGIYIPHLTKPSLSKARILDQRKYVQTFKDTLNLCCRCNPIEMAPVAPSRSSRSPDGLSITNKTEDNETSLVLTIGEEYISQW